MIEKEQCNLVQNVMKQFQTSYKYVQKELNSSLSKYGLTMAQYQILDILNESGRQSISDVMNKMVSTKGNMTVVIKNMLDRGWIDKCDAHNDKRKTVIWLSNSGLQLYESYQPKHKECVMKLFDSFCSEELVQLNELLTRFIK